MSRGPHHGGNPSSLQGQDLGPDEQGHPAWAGSGVIRKRLSMAAVRAKCTLLLKRAREIREGCGNFQM